MYCTGYKFKLPADPDASGIGEFKALNPNGTNVLSLVLFLTPSVASTLIYFEIFG